jgi:5-methylcytosine-specific restriction enzyme subunit McrC
MRLFEWRSKCFKKHLDELPEFINYLSGVWHTRKKYVDNGDEISEEEAQEEKIQKQRFFDFTVDGQISARNYVGVVQYNDIKIEVYPKIFADSKEEEPRKWQMNLLYWLMYCRRMQMPYSFADVAKLNSDNFLELLIYVFANFTEDIISKQPFQTYQHVEEETPFLKGRLLFDEYSKRNLITGKWHQFYCSHEPLIYDNLFNRIIKHVAQRMLIISEHRLNKDKLNDILFLLDDVSDINCIAEDCERVRLNPLYSDHKLILELCNLFLANSMIDMNADGKSNFCLLVPMEYVFEEFIFGFIAENWPLLNGVSQSTDFLAKSEGHEVFQIRNDIYIKQKLIIDTKYKIREFNDGLKKGISQSDLYQMVSYAIRRNCKDVLLLYPGTDEAAAHFQVPSAMFSSSINIYAQNVDITFDHIDEADELIRNRIRVLNTVFK